VNFFAVRITPTWRWRATRAQRHHPRCTFWQHARTPICVRPHWPPLSIMTTCPPMPSPHLAPIARTRTPPPDAACTMPQAFAQLKTCAPGQRQAIRVPAPRLTILTTTAYVCLRSSSVSPHVPRARIATCCQRCERLTHNHQPMRPPSLRRHNLRMMHMPNVTDTKGGMVARTTIIRPPKCCQWCERAHANTIDRHPTLCVSEWHPRPARAPRPIRRVPRAHRAPQTSTNRCAFRQRASCASVRRFSSCVQHITRRAERQPNFVRNLLTFGASGNDVTLLYSDVLCATSYSVPLHDCNLTALRSIVVTNGIRCTVWSLFTPEHDASVHATIATRCIGRRCNHFVCSVRRRCWIIMRSAYHAERTMSTENLLTFCYSVLRCTFAPMIEWSNTLGRQS